MSKIMEDEIASIIKERVDNFELQIDNNTSEPESRGIVIGCGSECLGLKAAVSAAVGHQIEIVNIHDFTRQTIRSRYSKELIIEPMLIIEDKNPHHYGWYRKMEKKKRWQR